MATDRVLEVGLIGFGLGGSSFHAPFIATTPGLHLSAVMTTDTSRRRLALERYHDVRIAQDFADLVGGGPKLDVIVVSTPNWTHYPLARAALEAGAHVVVDKPFAATPEQARAVGALARDVGRIAFPFQNRRWDGDFLTVQRLLREGALGSVNRFESRFDRWKPTPKPGWCKPDAREKCEDVVFDLCVHLIDQALVLFGPVAHVYAELGRRNPAVTTFDDAFIALTHQGGVLSHLYSSMTAGVLPPRMYVFGSRGAYMKYGLDVQEDALKAGGIPGSPHWGEEPEVQWGTLGAVPASERIRTDAGDYAQFYAGVARAIREDAPPPVSVADVTMGLEIVEAAYQSAREGRSVQPVAPIPSVFLS